MQITCLRSGGTRAPSSHIELQSYDGLKPNREQRGAPVLLALTATASACRGGRGASPQAGCTPSRRHAPCRCSTCAAPLRGPPVAAGRYESDGLAAGQHPWPGRCCCGGRAPLPAACRARWRAVMHDRPAYSSFLFSDGDLGERSSGRWLGRVGAGDLRTGEPESSE